jgi:deoxyadenosine/deoxycytidine kinase
MESTVKAPDLLIYLRSSIPNLVGQIHKRGASMKTLSIDYLSRLNALRSLDSPMIAENYY